MRVIDVDGEQRGIISIEEAIKIASSAELDLVEVASNAIPPVCRVMDYGKYKYREAKRFQEAKKKQNQIQLKEIKLRPKISSNDLEVKIRAAKRFLENRNRVKFMLQFKGREIAYTEIGYRLLQKVIDDLDEFGQVGSGKPKIEDRVMIITIMPK